jgi:hypothetical protein
VHKYEEFIDLLDSEADNSADLEITEALEVATEALAFIHGLNEALRESGARLPEVPDINKLGIVLDGVFGELAAASLFLSEDSFKRVPEMLRLYADKLEKMDVEFTDPEGVSGLSVPKAVTDGFRHFAKRLEATQVQKREILATLKNVSG